MKYSLILVVAVILALIHDYFVGLNSISQGYGFRFKLIWRELLWYEISCAFYLGILIYGLGEAKTAFLHSDLSFLEAILIMPNIQQGIQDVLKKKEFKTAKENDDGLKKGALISLLRFLILDTRNKLEMRCVIIGFEIKTRMVEKLLTIMTPEKCVEHFRNLFIAKNKSRKPSKRQTQILAGILRPNTRNAALNNLVEELGPTALKSLLDIHKINQI